MTAVPFRETVLFPNPHPHTGQLPRVPVFQFNIIPEQSKLKFQKLKSYDFTVNLIRYNIAKNENPLYNMNIINQISFMDSTDRIKVGDRMQWEK